MDLPLVSTFLSPVLLLEFLRVFLDSQTSVVPDAVQTCPTFGALQKVFLLAQVNLDIWPSAVQRTALQGSLDSPVPSTGYRFS